MRTISTLLLIAATSVPSLCAPVADVMVRPSSQVGSAGVKLADIAVVKTNDKALSDKLGDIPICQPPVAGSNRLLTRGQILVAMRRQGIEDETVNLLCPAQPVITRASATIPGQALVDAVRDYILGTKSWEGTVAVESVRIPSEQVVPAGSTEIRVRDEGAKPHKGHSTVPVEVVVDGHVNTTVYVSVNTRVFTPVLVAKEYIRRGVELTDANTVVENREVTNLTEESASALPEQGSVTMMAANQGVVIQRSWIAAPVAIKAGDKVIVVVKGNGVSVSDRGVADADGRPGDTIKVKLDGESRIVRAKVVESGLVEIRLR